MINKERNETERKTKKKGGNQKKKSNTKANKQHLQAQTLMT
jgi:hypothetical protein